MLKVYNRNNHLLVRYHVPWSIRSIGRARLYWRKGRWTIDDVMIQAKHRNQGHGTTMMKEIIEQFGAARLHVDYTNWTARRCYEKAGFTIDKWYDLDMRTLYTPPAPPR